jgi:hypothetical protein
MDALTPARRIDPWPLNGQVSLVHTAQPSMHSVTKHLTRPIIAFVLPAQRNGLPQPCGLRATRGLSRGFLTNLEQAVGYGLDFALNPQARRCVRPNRVRNNCYGLHVRLRLLSTPPHGDAVTFGYRERASPGGGLSPP